jgi:hypothetical protein
MNSSLILPNISGGAMRFSFAIVVVLLSFHAAADDNKATSLSDARNAVESNLRTAEGKAFDEKLGAEFVQNHLEALRRCKPSSGGDLQNFWILLKLEKDATAKEVLLYPSTRLGACARESLLAQKFLPAPRPDYWVSVYMKLSQ